MKYLKRYNKFNFQTNCRICLTQSVGAMVGLDSPLKGDSEQKPLIYEALEFVMSQRVDMSSKLPNKVCGMCAEFLKISYDLKIQYKESQQKLQDWLGDVGELKEKSILNHNQSKENKETPVEIVVGEQKFDIKDLVIIEEDEQDPASYDGFLHNLGTTISATFVDKGYVKPKLHVEPPHLVIEKVQENVSENGDDINENLFEITQELEDTDEQVIQDFDEIEQSFTEMPVDKNIIDKLSIGSENDRDVLESVLNMKYKCSTCNKPLSSLANVKNHSLLCGKKRKFKCYVCEQHFEIRKNLLRHLKKVHVIEINKAKSNKSGNHICNLCNQVFFSYGSLAYHVSKHQGRQFSCHICDKLFYTKGQVELHMQIHNRDKTIVVCPICGKGFHYQSGLFYHMKMHTNERKYKCNYCPRRFYTRNSIKRHELTHTGARPYDCKYCDKKFRSLGEVKKHQFLHTGERPFQCKYCNMAFIQMHNLKLHQMTHPGDFQCSYCSKGFVEEEVLRFHLQNKHQIKEPPPLNHKIDEYDTALDDDNGMDLTGEQLDSIQNEEEVIGGPVLEEEYFIMDEDFVHADDEDMSNLIVQTYEVQNEVLVEAIEDPQE